MTEQYEHEVDSMHRELAGIYRRSRGGLPLTGLEQVRVEGLWARIERMEAAHALVTAREKEAQK